MEDRRFDELTRKLAAPVSRRTALKAAVVTAVGGFFGLGATKMVETDAQGTCPPNYAVCPSSPGRCIYCPSGLFNGLCQCLPCPSGTTACGGACVTNCTAPFVLNPSTCTCQCPGFVAPCGTVCCPGGQVCVNGACMCQVTTTSPPCGGVCCGSGQTCVGGACCPAAQVCGATCCAAGQSCVSGACCPTAQVCGTTCCAAGQNCVNGTCATVCTILPGGTCGGANFTPACAANCQCGQTTDGTTACFSATCAPSGTCSVSADCPAGYGCIPASASLPCCGSTSNVCQPFCPSGAAGTRSAQGPTGPLLGSR